jgi:hypothetical protein
MIRIRIVIEAEDWEGAHGAMWAATQDVWGRICPHMSAFEVCDVAWAERALGIPRQVEVEEIFYEKESDIASLRASISRMTPGPVRIWAEPPEIGCAWKERLPTGSVCVETTGGIWAFGQAVAAFHDEVDADGFIALRNSVPAMLDELETLRARVSLLRSSLQAGRGALDREKRSFRSLHKLYDGAALALAKAREILKKATDNDGTLEELAELLVLDLNAEHARAEQAEQKLDGLRSSDAAEHQRLASSCEEYLEALAPPHISGDPASVLSQLAFELRLKQAPKEGS